MTPEAVVSVHDVRPSSLEAVLRIQGRLAAMGVAPVTLLVVPGGRWDAHSLSRLRKLVDRGCRLAGHGWEHRAPLPASLHHRLHARLLSRDQAEHLSRARADVRDRVHRCYEWFGLVGFPEPEMYVPPAWALGPLARSDLAELPFRWYEVLRGFLAARNGRLSLAPLVGFEADSRGRAVALRAVNRLNLALRGRWDRPLRIAIHPDDFRLRLDFELHAVLEMGWRFTTAESFLHTRHRAPAGSTATR